MRSPYKDTAISNAGRRTAAVLVGLIALAGLTIAAWGTGPADALTSGDQGDAGWRTTGGSDTEGRMTPLARTREELAQLGEPPAEDVQDGGDSGGDPLQARAAAASSRPNIVFILTDDQALYEMQALPSVQALIDDAGVDFSRAYVSYPLCCPARASLFTGKYMHNHGVRGNRPPDGSWQRFESHEPNSLGPWLQNQGYYTAHIGKYMNGYMSGGADHLPPGWNEWYGKVGATENAYLNYSLLEKGPSGPATEVSYGGRDDNSGKTDYQTDVYRYKARDFIDRVGRTDKEPFYLSVSFGAPHGGYVPAARHLYDYAGTPLPRLPGFDEKNMDDKPRWLRKDARKRLTDRIKANIAAERRRRLELLLSVDAAVAGIVEELEDQNLLDETYIIFSSDNGFFRGQHRIVTGKYLPHEPASHVPLLIRGPLIPSGRTSSELVSNLDITQTILDLANAPPSLTSGLDGRSLLPYARSPEALTTRPILLEGDTGPGRGAGGFIAAPATARARLARKAGVRNLDQERYASKTIARGTKAPAFRGILTRRYSFFLYANGEKEFYDLARDPAQLYSLHRNPRFKKVRKWLFNRLVKLIPCEGPKCREEIGKPPKPAKKKKKKRAAAKRRR
jgi:arylsulfatase A-like enzyme